MLISSIESEFQDAILGLDPEIIAAIETGLPTNCDDKDFGKVQKARELWRQLRDQRDLSSHVSER